MNDVKFATKHHQRILNGEKTVTARYGFDADITEGDTVRFTSPDGEAFATATITRIEDMELQAFVADTPDGHRTYESVESCITAFAEYYPDVGLDAETVLTVVWFREVSPVDDSG